MVKDYGLGYDENAEVDIARLNLKEYVRFICGEDSSIFRFMDARIEDLMDSVEIDHGEALIYPAVAVVSVLREMNRASLGMWIFHYYLWIWFGAGLLCMYFAGKFLTGRKSWGAAAAAAVGLHPRFFAEAFFNNKDVLMLSATAICLWLGICFVEKKNWKVSLLWGISVGFCTNLRVIGGLYGAAFGILYLADYVRDGWRNKKRFKDGLIAVAAMFGTFIFITPATWYGLGHYISYTLGNAAGFSRWNDWVLYRGQLYNYAANPLPWHYLIVFIGITTPIIIVMGIFAGQIYLIWTLFHKERNRYIVVCGAIVWLPMLFFIVKRGNVYNGWRHFYFIYPSLILIGTWALGRIEVCLKKWKSVIWAAIIAQGIFCVGLIALGHPLQFTYYNFLAGGASVEENFELDIWNVAFVHAIQQILESDDSEYIKLSSDEWNSYYGIKTACEVLPENDKVRIEFIEPDSDQCHEADYQLYSCTYITLQNKKIDAGIIEQEKWTPADSFKKYFSVEAYGRAVIDIYSKEK